MRVQKRRENEMARAPKVEKCQKKHGPTYFKVRHCRNPRQQKLLFRSRLLPTRVSVLNCYSKSGRVDNELLGGFLQKGVQMQCFEKRVVFSFLNRPLSQSCGKRRDYGFRWRAQTTIKGVRLSEKVEKIDNF